MAFTGIPGTPASEAGNLVPGFAPRPPHTAPLPARKSRKQFHRQVPGTGLVAAPWIRRHRVHNPQPLAPAGSRGHVHRNRPPGPAARPWIRRHRVHNPQPVATAGSKGHVHRSRPPGPTAVAAVMHRRIARAWMHQGPGGSVGRHHRGRLPNPIGVVTGPPVRRHHVHNPQLIAPGGATGHVHRAKLPRTGLVSIPANAIHGRRRRLNPQVAPPGMPGRHRRGRLAQPQVAVVPRAVVLRHRKTRMVVVLPPPARGRTRRRVLLRFRSPTGLCALQAQVVMSPGGQAGTVWAPTLTSNQFRGPSASQIYLPGGAAGTSC